MESKEMIHEGMGNEGLNEPVSEVMNIPRITEEGLKRFGQQNESPVSIVMENFEENEV